jgi:hypothetical protein
MSEVEVPAWMPSAYPNEARDIIEAHDAIVRDIDEKIKTLSPEEVQRVRRWAELPTDARDFRTGIPLMLERMKDLAMLLEDQELMRRVLWSIDAFQYWLQRLHSRQISQ